MNDTYRIMKVANGWVFDTSGPEWGNISRLDQTYIFTSSKKLAKFIEKLDEKEKDNENAN